MHCAGNSCFIFLPCRFSICIFALRVLFAPSFQAKQGSCNAPMSWATVDSWETVNVKNTRLRSVSISGTFRGLWSRGQLCINKYQPTWSAFPKTCSTREPLAHCGCVVSHPSRQGYHMRAFSSNAVKQQLGPFRNLIVMKCPHLSDLQDVWVNKRSMLRELRTSGPHCYRCRHTPHVTHADYILFRAIRGSVSALTMTVHCSVLWEE